MKHIFLSIIAIFFCGIQDRNNSDIDYRLVEEYAAGQKRVLHILEENGLVDVLNGHTFYAYLMGETWLIVAQASQKTMVFFPTLRTAQLVKREYWEELEELKAPFSFKELDKKKNKWSTATKYHPIYRYFVLFDSTGKICYEWNTSTDCVDSTRVDSVLRRCVLFVYSAKDNLHEWME